MTPDDLTPPRCPVCGEPVAIYSYSGAGNYSAWCACMLVDDPVLVGYATRQDAAAAWREWDQRRREAQDVQP